MQLQLSEIARPIARTGSSLSTGVLKYPDVFCLFSLRIRRCGCAKAKTPQDVPAGFECASQNQLTLLRKPFEPRRPVQHEELDFQGACFLAIA